MSYSQLLRIRPFRNLWLGQAISQLGDALYYVAFVFMAGKVTGSIAMVGYVGALEAVPYLLFGPYSGVLADRLDRRAIMLASDLASGLMLVVFGASVLVLGKPFGWMFLVLAFGLSSVRCFFMPAKSAAIPALVPAEGVVSANALSSLTFNQTQMLGLALSAGILGALYQLSATWFFAGTIFLNSLSFLGSAAFVYRLPRIRPEQREAKERHPVSDFRAGFRYVRGRRELLVLIVLLTGYRLMVAPFFVVYVATNDRWFGGAPATLSWLECVFSVGMVLSSVAAGKLRMRLPGLNFCVCLGVVGIVVGLMAFSRIVWLFALCNFVCGLFIPVAEIPISAYLQLSTPDGYRGRVIAMLNTVATGVTPVGWIVGGLLVLHWGVVWTYLIMGSGMAIASLSGLLESHFRTIEMPTSDSLDAANPEVQTLLPA